MCGMTQTIDIPASLVTLLPTLHLQPSDDGGAAGQAVGGVLFWAIVVFAAYLLLKPILRRL